jgi:hypothetical protein
MAEDEPKRGSGRWLVRIIVAAGWLAAAVVVCALFVEHSGLLSRWLEGRLRRRLAPAPIELAIGDVEVRWLDRTLVVRGLTFGEDGRDVTVERLDVLFGWAPFAGARVERATLEGGHMRLSQALRDALESWGLDDDETVDFDVTHLPLLAVRELDVSIEADGIDVPIGLVDASLVPGRDRPRLLGRLRPRAVAGVAQGEVLLTGELEEGGTLVVRGAARGLYLAPELLPEGTPLESARPLDPRAVFDLSATGRYTLGVSVLPEIVADLHLREGSLRLPHITAADTRRAEPITARVRAEFTPGNGTDLWTREVWRVEAQVEARWENIPCTVGARIGRAAAEDALADAWLHLPEVTYGEGVMELIGGNQQLVDLREMLDPAGSAEVALGLRFPRGWVPGPRASHAVARCVRVQASGATSIAYVGERNRKQDGVRNIGFPLRLQRVTGHVTYAYAPDLPLEEQLGLFELVGHHPSGTARVNGSMWAGAPWREPGWEPGGPSTTDFHLSAVSEDLPVDDDLERAFQGLVGVTGVAEIFPTYRPSGGSLDFSIELRRLYGQRGLATTLDLEFDDVGFTWAEFPAPLDGVSGKLLLRGDGRGDHQDTVGVALDVEGRSSGAVRGSVRLRGNVLSRGAEAPVSWFELDAEGVNPRSQRLRGALSIGAPDALRVLDETTAAGFVDLHLEHVHARPDDPRLTTMELSTTAEGIRGQPASFPMDTHAVHGRAIIASVLPALPDPDAVPEVTTRAALRGQWLGQGQAVPVALTYDGRPDRDPRLTVRVAGLDVENPTVTGALLASLARDGGREMDPSKLDFAGHLDATAEFELSRDPTSDEFARSDITLYARLERLGLPEVDLLSDLRGKLSYSLARNTWTGERVTARLGTTSVELTDLSFGSTPLGSRLEMVIHAAGLPVDEEHLRHFLDEATLRSLLDDLQARGTLDIDGARLVLESFDVGSSALRLAGALRLSNAFVRLGLPVSIARADRIDLDLRYEIGHVRARARVEELSGKVARRRLSNASMQLTYVEPRLTIEEFDGEFEAGRLRSLGLASVGGAGFFSIDLEEPYPFALSTELSDIDVGGLLAGVFNSDFANEGRLDGQLRLNGSVGKLTGIRGAGQVRLTDSALWAIPVFQSLFSQLGFDTTATFKEMQTGFVVENGELRMQRMQVKSDLLSLVGEGVIDFEGGLAHDLEVRYGLVDHLGPLTQLLYKIQNSLLRVSIRGDMSRPEVVLKGFFSQFFAPPRESHLLPLPALSGLPTRF